MKLIAAYLLLVQGGNESPSASDIKELLGTVGVEADDARLDKLISELSGKTLSEVIAEGSSKLASVPSGGGGGGGAVAATAAGGAAAPAAEAPKEEKKEEEKEESDDDMMSRSLHSFELSLTFYLRLRSIASAPLRCEGLSTYSARSD